MNKTYCIKSKKYGKFENIEITYQFYKTLVISVGFSFFFSFLVSVIVSVKECLKIKNQLRC